MTSGEFSSDLGTDVLIPASAAHGPEQHPPATEAERKLRRRPSAREENSDDALTPPDDEPVHRVDDLA
jgi:hypothetical protein